MLQKEKIFAMMGILKADACLITSPENIRYITGLKNPSAMVVVTVFGNIYYITDSRYIEETRTFLKDKNFKIMLGNGNLLSTVKKIIVSESIRSIAFEDLHTTCFAYTNLEAILGIPLVPLENGIRNMRLIKDDFEVQCTKTSLQIAEHSLEQTFNSVKIGMTELEVRANLTYNLLNNGSELGNFGIVAVSGKNSSLPHGTASDKKLEKGDFLLVDFGAIYKGYYSDITRTVAIGNATAKMEQVYDIVLKANLAGIGAIKNTQKAEIVDKAARNIITDAGYGEYFLHGLGHGVGQEIHEKPRLSADSGDILQSGNIVTIEPGIYIPNEFGVRIEDMLLVTDSGAENLTVMSKEFRVL